jgi:hypothetical protein
VTVWEGDGMIRHVVMFRFADIVTDAEVDALSSALDALPAAIPEISVYHHGRDLGLHPANYAYAIVAEFASADDFATYRDHPEHQRFIADHITGKVADRAAVQFEY